MKHYAKRAVEIDGKLYNAGDIIPNFDNVHDKKTAEKSTTTQPLSRHQTKTEVREHTAFIAKPVKIATSKVTRTPRGSKK
jgi:hypothetical protein